MNTKVGRNDPCPCGSGKKYKRCHLPLDQQHKPLAEAKPVVKQAEEESEYLPPAIPDNPSPAFLRELVEKVPQNKRGEFSDILKQAVEVAEYMEAQEEIATAGHALEAHREEFNKLLADEPSFLKQARALFGEERFAPLRFTAQDVRRAFDHVGGPPNLSNREDAAKKLHAAIVFLADKEKRTKLAMSLLKHLSNYVKAGRFMDAWLIQYCAHSTMEFVKESNAFLYEMFCYGFDAWSSEKEARNEELLRDLGLDKARLQSMSLDEMNDYMEKLTANPVMEGRVEEFFRAHPEQRQLAVLNMEEMESEYVTLLAREDSRPWLLTPEEIAPWLPRLFDCWQKAVESKPELASSGPSDEESRKAFQAVILPILVEMAQTMFTAERVAQLIVQLDNSQKALFAAGEKRMATCAMTAIGSLKRDLDPGKNYFLHSLCYSSLRALLASEARQSSAQD